MGAFFVGNARSNRNPELVLMRRASTEIVELIEPVVSGLGYEFVGAEFGQTENGQTLRIYIDKPQGIVIDDCAIVSRQLNAVMDVEDAISSKYLLEVSSPGIDRPLFTPEHFAKNVDGLVKLKLLSGVDGRRNFKGKLISANCDEAVVEVDGLDYLIPLNDIAEAYLLTNT